MGIEFARSLAGHDKGKVYLLAGEDGNYAYLADGEARTLDHPKRKNARHIQRIRRLPDEVLSCLSEGETDLAVKRAIRTYERILARDREQEE